MGLTRLEISNIRNLQSVRVDLKPGFNALCGPNGSGKTSFLEAVYLLGRGTSFRSKDLSRILPSGVQQFYVSGKLDASIGSLGVEFQASGIQFRVAVFNSLNHANFEAPEATFGTPAFGSVTKAGRAREIEIALKFLF